MRKLNEESAKIHASSVQVITILILRRVNTKSKQITDFVYLPLQKLAEALEQSRKKVNL